MHAREIRPAIRQSELEQFFVSAALLTSLKGSQGDSEERLAFSRNILASAFDQFWPKLKTNREKLAEQRRRTAAGFNVFDFVAPSENVLSDILQFFLDPEASHGQADIFLRLLLSRARPEPFAETSGATVAREALTYSLPERRRIDILVTMPNFLLAIETKKFTGESNRQIHDYCHHLQNITRKDFCLILLNRTGAEASSIAPELASGFKRKRQLMSWSWQNEIRAWLVDCIENCEPQKIHHFAEDFSEYITAYLASKEDVDETN